MTGADKKINRVEIDLDEQCIHIIARRQPVATDLRTLISIMNASTDLERIGDEAGRIAKMSRAISHLEYPADQYSDFRNLASMVSSILAKSLDAFARLDSESAIKVIEADKEIDNCYDDTLQQRGAWPLPRQDVPWESSAFQTYRCLWRGRRSRTPGPNCCQSFLYL